MATFQVALQGMFLSSHEFSYLGISSSYVKVIVELPVPEPPGLRTPQDIKADK